MTYPEESTDRRLVMAGGIGLYPGRIGAVWRIGNLLTSTL